MPDRTRLLHLGTVAAVLILLAAAGARASWPAASVTWPGSGRVAVTGILVEAALAALLIILRRGHAAAGRQAPAKQPEDLAARAHRILNTALVIALVAVPALVLLDELHLIRGRPHFVEPLPERLRKHRFVIPPAHSRGFTSGPITLDLLIAALIVVLIVLAVLAWRRLRKTIADRLPDLEPDLTEDKLARAVESGQAALLEFDDARLAIIRCYLAMEHSLAEAGAVRGAAETPDELLVRSVAAGLVPRPPASLLTALFYEARFSTHPMPPEKRDQARQALTDLAADLPRPASVE
jgi:hypothetical protein